ncbi:MAG: histidine--tRNA ligase, partial [Bacteroidetes bacterium]|nr:histidine--tRNA ligase [Bacteroidota bacterium]
GEAEENYCLELIKNIRKEGLNAEIYPEQAKMKKQMAYADNKKIPYVGIVGSDEINNNTITLKNMESGEQQKLPAAEVIKLLKMNHNL